MLVSVIVPVYNTEKYLLDCVQSILQQTYTELECILVDDGSTDNSYFIANEYAKKCSNIILLKQKNSGQSITRNRAMSIAKGKYIFFCDSDDFIDKNSLSKLIDTTQ